jgi:type II secretion system protein C
MNVNDVKFHQIHFIAVINIVLGAAILFSLVYFARTLSEVALKNNKRNISALNTKPFSQGESAIGTYDAVIRNNPFGVPAGSLEHHPFASESPSTLDIKLTGTISGALRHGYAVFINQDGTQSMFKTGEEVFGMGKLESVAKDKAFIRKGGQLVKIPMIDLANEVEAIGAPSSGDLVRLSGQREYILDQRALQFALDHPAQIMTDAKLIPNMINNRQDGFVLREVKENGIYSKLGMRNGDVLLRINGANISNPENAFQAFMALKGLNKVQFDMIRDGNKITQNYLIR